MSQGKMAKVGVSWQKCQKFYKVPLSCTKRCAKLAKMSKVLQSSSKLHQKMFKVGKNVKSFAKLFYGGVY